MSQVRSVIGLDVGAKRIGVARGNTLARLATPLETISVDGSELDRIAALAAAEDASVIVVGLPRNLAGEETDQTRAVRAFVDRLTTVGVPLVWQDEAGTTAQALEEAKHGKSIIQIDAHAAAIILQDYLDGLA